jgi:hypothetical protein
MASSKFEVVAGWDNVSELLADFNLAISPVSVHRCLQGCSGSLVSSKERQYAIVLRSNGKSAVPRSPEKSLSKGKFSSDCISKTCELCFEGEDFSLADLIRGFFHYDFHRTRQRTVTTRRGLVWREAATHALGQARLNSGVS